jgi:hypothetical protein
LLYLDLPQTAKARSEAQGKDNSRFPEIGMFGQALLGKYF